ncbi:Single-stranded DNA-binding protein, mitochondrial-like protein [Drosera capensis]
MNPIVAKFIKNFTGSSRSRIHLAAGVQRNSRLCQSTLSFVDDIVDDKKSDAEDADDGFASQKREFVPQGVDPRKGWNFRGVHKAIICGTVGQTPVQKLLRNGKTLTIFNVGTGGMFDQRLEANYGLPQPPQWHRVVVHNEPLGKYCVQKLIKNSSVYVEGDIETRVYNKSISGEIVKLSEICVRFDGKIRLIQSGEKINGISFEELSRELQEKDASDHDEDDLVVDLESLKDVDKTKLDVV